MNKTIKLAFASAAVFAAIQASQAAPIVGYIGFHGEVTLDAGSVNTATEATAWNSVVVGGADGSFASTVNVGDAVTMSSSGWFFNSVGGGGIIQPFWSVGGFTFTLATSTVVFDAFDFINVDITGTVSAAGYDDTAFTGSFSSENPGAGGNSFGMSASFGTPLPSVPDGGMTVMLLGSALAGLGLMKKKLAA